MYAVEGIKTSFKNEPNLKRSVFAGFFAATMGYLFNISTTEWLILSYTIVFVILIETINTSLEAIVDLISPGIHPKAKIAKDVAAGAVLIAVFQSIIVGLIIFAPKAITLLQK